VNEWLKDLVNEDRDISIPCPKCGHQFSQKLGMLKLDHDITCPACGERFRIDPTKFMDRLRSEINELLDHVQKTLGLS
jgi:DNA-directed RNA polymerase subunit RPC12/RpoP